MSKLLRLHNYPAGSEVQRNTGTVYVKDRDGKWHPRGRVKMAKWLGRALEDNEKVYHLNTGDRDNDEQENLVVIKFTATTYRLRHSRPVYIPPEPVVKTEEGLEVVRG